MTVPLFLTEAHDVPVWWVLSVIFVALLFLGIAKAGFGGGVGLVTPPLLAQVLPMRVLLPLMLPLLIACDLASLWSWRGKWDWRNVFLLLPGTVVGVLAGTGLLKTVPEDELKAGLGTIAVAFVVIQVWRQRRAGGDSGYQPTPWHGAVAGFLGGFCSVLAHAAGPVITLFLLPQGLGKARFVATTVLYFSVLNWIKVPSYVWAGMLTGSVLYATVWLAPIVLFGVYAGIRLNKLVPERAFNNLIYALVVLTGIKLAVPVVLGG